MVLTDAFDEPDIVGREAALRDCASAVNRARGGNGGLLLITGEPGIGKTAVLQAAVAQARARGCRALWAACPEEDVVPAFWPLVRVLAECDHPLTRSAAEELRGGEARTQGEDRLVLFDRVASALREVASHQALVVALDDLHWADPSSLRLLGFLVKQLRTAPVLVMGSYRDTDVGSDHPLMQLLAEPGTSGDTVALSGLATEDVTTLVARACGAGARAAAGRIHAHTGGNPFFVLHVARLLDAEGHLTSAAGSLPLPLGVRAVLERRLARLSQPCHDLLGTAAVLGARFELALLAEVSRADPAAVRDLLDEAATARLVQVLEPGRSYEFAHALVRATVSAQWSAARTAEVHGRVADTLRHRPGDLEVRLTALAHHELNSPGDRPATRGVDAAERAGRQAVSARAFEQAGEFFTRAIAVCRDEERLAELTLALGDARLRSGDWASAATAFAEAAELARHLDRADLVARAALGIGADTGGFEVRLHDHRQLALLEEALTRLGSTHPELRAHLLARRAVAATNIASPEERRSWSDQSVALARDVDDPRTLAYSLSAWCDVQSGPAYVEQRLTAAAEMLSVAETADDREAALLARRFRVVALLEHGDPEVHEEIARFAAVAEALGQPLYRWYVPLFRGMQAMLRGDLDEADQLCERAAALGLEAGSDNARMLSATLAAAIDMERGHFLELAAVYETSLAEEPWLRELPIALAMAPLLDIAHGRHDEARARLHRFAEERFASVPLDSEYLSTLHALASATLELEDEASATVLYGVLLPHAGLVVVDGIAASCLDPVDYLLGRLALVAGRPADAAGHLRAAAEQAARLGAPLLRAHADHALATALAMSDPSGSWRLRERAEVVLRAAGASPRVVFGPGTAEPAEPGVRGPVADGPRTGVFHREGTSWTLTFEGRTVRLPDTKGLNDLRHLLARPSSPVPVTALHRSADPGSVDSSRGIEVLDDQARNAYRRRLADLDDEIAEAHDFADTEREARARDERDFLLAELTAAVGLGGRSRRMGDEVERARKAVTMRIRHAIDRIEREHPTLGRHLALAVRTGRVCSYEPERPVTWSL